MEFFHHAMWHMALGWHAIEFAMRLWDHNIEFAWWQHPAIWQVALLSWHWVRQVAAPCTMTRGSGIMTMNLPGGNTLQCGTWLWKYMPLNSPKRPPYWNSTSGFDFYHITAVDMSLCTILRNFIHDVMSIFKMADHRHLGFYDSIMGSLKSPCTTSYKSSIETIAWKCLVFEKIAFLHFGDNSDRMADLRHFGFWRMATQTPFFSVAKHLK